MGGIGDTGISASYLVPRYIAKIEFAVGALSAGSQRLRVLLVGMKTSAGSMAVDSAPIRITSPEDADALAGPGSQLAMMAYAALSIAGVEVWIQAVAEPSSGTAAKITMVISGTQTAGGVLRFRLAGKPITCNVGPLDTPDIIGANIVAAFMGKVRLPATAAYDSSSSTVTVTIKNKGVGGKDWILYQDVSQGDAPPGLVLTVAGSATVNTLGWRFGASSTGTGAEDATTSITKLHKSRWARIAVGHNDAVNAALWEAEVNADGGPLSLLLDQLVFAHNGTKAQAKSLAQTTLNAFRGMVNWLRNSENHPCEIAALIAAIRSTVEQASPVPDFDHYLLDYLAPQAFEDDYPTDPEQDEVLNAGVTPLTTVDGDVQIVRAICTYCMSNGQQDVRCLDIGDPVFTDYATLDMKLMYETDFRPQNPIVEPDPSPEEEPPAAGVAYPRAWTAKEVERLFEYRENGWTARDPIGEWAPVSTFNEEGGFIATDTPLPVARIQHRLDNCMRQISTVG